METLTLAIERSGDTIFGCLTDSEDKLLSSAFGNTSKIVQAHLVKYSKTIGDVSPRSGSRMTRLMVNLFNGKDPSESAELNTQYVSKFQQQVYSVLGRIPKGKVTTYGSISKYLGSAPRAVGGAVASNPWPLFIPCQRVVNFDLTVGNYGMCGKLGKEGTVTKRTLLERETVPIIDGRVGRTAIWDPSRN